MRRGYLLPEGCKDLMDVLKLNAKRVPKPKLPPTPALSATTLVELAVPEQLSVAQLAGLLGEKPAQIIFELIKIGVYAAVSQSLDFETVSHVLRRYGFMAKKVA